MLFHVKIFTQSQTNHHMLTFFKKLIQSWFSFEPTRPQSLDVTVGFVNDGDTFQAKLSNGQKCTVRLYSIDAPERGHGKQPEQPFSQQSTERLKQLLGSQARLEVIAKDRFGRTLALVYPKTPIPGYQDNTSVNEILVFEGLAWANDKFKHMHPKGQKIKFLGIHAKQEQKGIWSQSYPVSPHIWRSRI